MFKRKLYADYLTDWQDNNAAVVSSKGDIVQKTAYYPYGEPTVEPSGQRFLFGGKEREHAAGRNTYDFSARCLTPYGRWGVNDTKAEDFYPFSPYSYCGGDPINHVDRNGMEWKYVCPDNGDNPHFEFVPTAEAYDDKGNLLPHHYIQAISFSSSGSKGSFDKSKSHNIGTATATVYKADGSTEDFDACTNPSDPSKFATVPDGRYEAKVGKHKVGTSDEYPALRMGDVGTTDFYNNQIELGAPNPSNESTTIAKYINIHKAGKYNYTGMTTNGGAVSKGCILIDRDRWNDFISIFDTPKQRNNIVGIILMR